MRLPLELLRIILDHFEESYSRPLKDTGLPWSYCTNFLALRLVNRTFDQEILSYALRNPRSRHQVRLINGNSWMTAPLSLRDKYLRFKIKLYQAEPNLFATLFVPVFEKACNELRIETSDTDAGHVLLEQLLQIPTHDRELSWVVAHKPWKYDSAQKRLLTFPFDEYSEDEEENLENWRSRQIKEDWLFAQVCCAIVKDDCNAVTQLLQNTSQGIAFNRPSLCFGTTLVRFVLQHSDFDMLRLVLQHGSYSRNFHPYDDFRFVYMTEDGDAIWKIYALFDSYFQDVEIGDPGRVMDDIIWFGMWKGHLTIVDCALQWVNENWDLAQRWYILDRAFVNAIYAGNLNYIKRLFPEMEQNQRYSRKTVLQLAIQAQKPKLEILQFFLNHGAEVNPEPSVPSLPSTYAPLPKALFMAADRGLARWVEVLLEAGADPRSEPGEESLMYYARMSGIHHLVSCYLNQHGWYRNGTHIGKGKGKAVN